MASFSEDQQRMIEDYHETGFATCPACDVTLDYMAPGAFRDRPQGELLHCPDCGTSITVG